MEVLRKAFEDVATALDDIGRYRREELPKLAGAIGEFERLSSEADEIIVRMTEGNDARKALAQEPSNHLLIGEAKHEETPG